LPADSVIVGYARTKMDANEFHKRVSSYIKTIGAEQERKLKEFLVRFLDFRVDVRN
jgi:glucose-6-phosphate 1-dehydrogenase